MIKKKG